jgi:hypothetical protein
MVDSLAIVSSSDGYQGRTKIINIANPMAPQLLSQINMGGTKIEITDTFAYLLNRWGIEVIDFSDPVIPEGVTIYRNPPAVKAVSVQTDYAFVSNGGMLSLDISDLHNPLPVGFYEYSTPNVIAIRWPYAYAGGFYFETFEIIDISDPANMSTVGNYLTDDAVRDISLNGDYAYLLTDSSFMTIMDISDPVLPRAVNIYCDYHDPSYAIATSGDYAYVLGYYRGLATFDISDRIHPTPVDTLEMPGVGMDLAIDGQYMYVADADSGLLILDIGVPDSAFIVANLRIPMGNATKIFVEGNFAYLWARYPHRYPYSVDHGILYVIDISLPLNPALVASRQTPGNPQDIFVSDGDIFLADNSSFLICHFEPTGVANENQVPDSPGLLRAYPNPFNSSTTISIARVDRALITIFDISGRKIATLQTAGGQAVWDARNFASGLYFARLDNRGRSTTAKLILLK